MKYCLTIAARDYKELFDCLSVEPYAGRALFCLTEMRRENGLCVLRVADIVAPKPGDFIRQTADGFAFSHVYLINTLGRANAENKSLLYIHTHPPGVEIECRANGDEKMLFRIAYGICPFGAHASLLLRGRSFTGDVWLPGLETAPLQVIPSRCRPEGPPQSIAAGTGKA